ncbi:acetyl-CoA carboxylase biotin carboxylase subunit [Ramlibacter sp.]|uniref:acetyl-CoA carboxylase biotin carboxylase subunit n=1 Tax=Ramlibacter sp. TaxID=1917967 RepID=UPI0039C93118
MRTCRELGLETVAVHSSADADSMHVRMADRAVCIGPPPSAQSYLVAPALVAAALGTGADAIHPGYGFLSENADFARLCADQGVTFIGPSPEAIDLMGNKAAARQVAAQLEVPTVPGSKTPVRSCADALAAAKTVGYPVLLKASAGGGGRGMRVVQGESEMDAAWQDASREALAAFGDATLYVERRLSGVRHIEIQLLGDGGEGAVSLGHRDCSIQRRRQKLLEESPGPALSAALLQGMSDAALRIARHLRYSGAGTIEFVVTTEPAAFYFIEMNTRIQVEHPVTEMLTGVDIVAEQIRVANGEPMELTAGWDAPRSHAIECRINAESPTHGFRPSPGRIARWQPPGGPGVRVDSHCREGYVVQPFYDSMIAKVVVCAPDRDSAIRRMRRALSEFVVEGPDTTISFHLSLLSDPEFGAGKGHTTWVEDHFLARFQAGRGRI